VVVVPGAPDPAEILAGERLFLEGRFAQFFEANAAGNLNAPLVAGDPELDMLNVEGGQVVSPFTGDTFSCGACHMVDQALDLPGAGMRTYDDFSIKTPVTQRNDGLPHTVRNSPPLVNASIARSGPTVFHFDGEFATLEDLVVETLLGRNYGWLPTERATALAHVAAVIRQDDGLGALASEFGNIPFFTLLDFNATGVPAEFDSPAQFKIDMATATDGQIVDAVAALIAEYTRNLAFTRDANDHYDGSPYDAFLAKNNLPQAPAVGQTPLDYARALLTQIEIQLSVLQFVNEGSFEFHDQNRVFGQTELLGLVIFLRETPPSGMGGAGNCAACHTPPDFTDFAFHNVGFTQDEYDAVHGPGAFFALSVPDLTTRDGDFDAYLPPTAAHPMALGPYRSLVDLAHPTWMDLGLWNLFANPDFPANQTPYLMLLDTTYGPGTSAMTNAQLLPLTEGLFKTPGLRDLSHSSPYGHSGRFDALEDVLNHYLEFSELARGGFVRNADPRLMDIDIVFGDIAPLAAFLRSLNEDYN
jgi:cytochrome c peroxidase